MMRYFISLDKEIPDLIDTSSGYYMAMSLDYLDKIARRKKVTPLRQFMSISKYDALAFLDEEGEKNFPDEKWFQAKDGLKTLRALGAHMAKHPNELKRQEYVEDDIKHFIKILVAASKHSAKWHLSPDI